MEDAAELAALRAQRMAEMRAGASRSAHGGGQDQQAAAAERQRQAEDMKDSILSQILDQGARARLNTLMVAKPEKGARVEATLIRMAQTGQLGGRIGEDELIGILERMSGPGAPGGGSSAAPKVKFDRRRARLDSDSD